MDSPFSPSPHCLPYLPVVFPLLPLSPLPLPPCQAMAQVNHVEASLSVFASNAIYVGGFRSDGRSLYCLHGHDLPGAEEVSVCNESC